MYFWHLINLIWLICLRLKDCTLSKISMRQMYIFSDVVYRRRSASKIQYGHWRPRKWQTYYKS